MKQVKSTIIMRCQVQCPYYFETVSSYTAILHMKYSCTVQIQVADWGCAGPVVYTARVTKFIIQNFSLYSDTGRS